MEVEEDFQTSARLYQELIDALASGRAFGSDDACGLTIEPSKYSKKQRKTQEREEKTAQE